MVELSIIIVNWNTGMLLENCLSSIQSNLCDCEYEIIVIDNASIDNDLDNILKQNTQTRIIYNHENVGFARANNQGISIATGNYLLILNPDTVIKPHSIDILIQYLAKNKNVAAVGPKLLNADGTLQVSASRSPTLAREFWRLLHLDRLFSVSQYPLASFINKKPISVDILLGACILIRSQVIKEVGLLDEDYFVYSEEVDLCERIRKNGWRLHWVPDAEVIHFGGMSTRQASLAMFIELYRNKIKFFRKNKGIIQVRIYKLIIWIASIIRIIVCSFLKMLPLRNRDELIAISNNYLALINELPEL